MLLSPTVAGEDHISWLSHASDAELESALVEAQRRVNTAEAERAPVVAALLARARDADRAPGGQGALTHQASYQEFVADHVAALLACTRAVANVLLDVAVEASTHPALARAWRDGDIDSRKVAVVTELMRDCDRAVSARLVESAIAYARSHTAPQLRVWLDRRVLRADPSQATIRRRRATGERKVTLTPVADGMAELSAYLPGVCARQLYDTVNAAAMCTDSADRRTMDQRRADVMVDLIVGRAEPPQVSVNVLVTAETLLETESEPAWVSGVGAVTPEDVTALLVAGQTTWRRLMVDDTSGVLTDVGERQYRPSARLERAVRARDLTCRFPGCRRSALGVANGTDLDHTVAWPDGSTRAGNLAVLCRHHHRLKHSGGWQVRHDPGGRMTWTTPGGRQVVTLPWGYLEPPDSVPRGAIGLVCSPDPPYPRE